jgi:hypothetical protein
MTRIILAAVAAVIVGGCGGSDGNNNNGATCGAIEGQYTVTGTEQNGTCGPGGYPDTATISKSGSQYSVTWSSSPGTKCPVTVTNCNLSGSCVFNAGGISVTNSYAYIFTSTGFSGVDSVTAPSSASFAGCTSTYRETGTKK